ncbi:MAG TPA: fibronectin type III domain-containing protein [Polyangia bacterium]|nr:fibronectin type III domain-containing protein [Polyangia bacterium]
MSRFASPRSITALALIVAALAAFASKRARATTPSCSISYTFQPDCYHPNGGAACGQTLAHLDFGPQIAVWLETADHTLVDTLMVTNLTAARGIGNRPGIWNFRSGPKFPYGKRWMSLPLWAYARGKLYNAVFMQDDREDWMGFHEAHSSKEPFFCRPVMQTEVNLSVDAITCPSAMFNSAKGKLESTTKVYYPPRNDLTSFINQDCDVPGASLPSCAMSAMSYAAINDLDAVASATPGYGQPYSRTWRLPDGLPAGDYVLAVEVNKEFDTNAAHSYPGYADVNGGLTAYGIDGNFGQPSVLYRVPIHLGGATTTQASVATIAGYSKWGAGAPLDGTLLIKDGTISTDVPGSGEMRLLAIDGPTGKGRVHVEVGPCALSDHPLPPTCDGGSCDAGVDVVDAGAPPDAGVDLDAGVETAPPPVDECKPLPAPPSSVTGLVSTAMTATSVTFEFVNASSNGKAVTSYEIRYREGETMTAAEFDGAINTSIVDPGAPGSKATFTIPDLKPSTSYVVGVRAVDGCDQRSALATKSFNTTVMKFTQLSGCFVATAAYGSALEPHVAALRHARDRLRPASPLFAAATDLYYRSGPAAAAVVGESEVARALARRVLAPFAGLAQALDAVAR